MGPGGGGEGPAHNGPYMGVWVGAPSCRVALSCGFLDVSVWPPLQTVEHGFPHQPSALGYSPALRILAIGTRSGAVKLYPFRLPAPALQERNKAGWGGPSPSGVSQTASRESALNADRGGRWGARLLPVGVSGLARLFANQRAGPGAALPGSPPHSHACVHRRVQWSPHGGGWTVSRWVVFVRSLSSGPFQRQPWVQGRGPSLSQAAGIRSLAQSCPANLSLRVSPQSEPAPILPQQRQEAGCLQHGAGLEVV